MRILLLEDYGPLRDAMAQSLREAGYAVDDTGDGKDALYFLRANTYVLAILDLMVPGASGMEVLRQIREKESGTPVMIVTARDKIGDRVAGLDAGADDYLVKPFAMDELMARVRALVRRSFGKESSAVTVGDLEIDTKKRQAWRGGVALTLTRREFDLLELLMLRTGEVVSRGDIWEQIYEFGEEAESNVIDVFIASLRKKIENPERPKLIHTRRGEGYVLEERE